MLMEKAKWGDMDLMRNAEWRVSTRLPPLVFYPGLQDASDTTIKTLKAIEHLIPRTAQTVVEVCAFAGTGNVLKRLLDTFPSFAVIAVALIATGEDVRAEMSLRQFYYLMCYGEPIIRKSVPLAIGLYSHDNDLAIALDAIFAALCAQHVPLDAVLPRHHRVPQLVITLDEELNNKPVTAIDIVGQVGIPRTISGADGTCNGESFRSATS
ncbi:26S proteasome regulatory subunit RPN1 [Mycena sanguinolenta]|uniref:26S proteasome regulatory subunit RPN1 n=1 Tax=Mycena sanguinolenta TaxID=230812 RepID=A0A8H7CZ19_9AGAR|nr:26S proteasome regulatory subunit RPN1 [Mycena sanguinolenta]